MVLGYPLFSQNWFSIWTTYLSPPLRSSSAEPSFYFTLSHPHLSSTATVRWRWQQFDDFSLLTTVQIDGLLVGDGSRYGFVAFDIDLARSLAKSNCGFGFWRRSGHPAPSSTTYCERASEAASCDISYSGDRWRHIDDSSEGSEDSVNLSAKREFRMGDVQGRTGLLGLTQGELFFQLLERIGDVRSYEDLDVTLYPLSAGLAPACDKNIGGNWL
ncbi:PREDICTED: uncharacterized protein LOC109186458 [Ipomoea nil]|uniref:uncharacterized protein LOC109186458 n=1 Tax=Ipomoea nil TaxID=35883 RepID=UPI00090107DF|nr:PREDICTED: uncharacterized protein LOC109186458 [Ipomoea nil]